MASPPDGKTSMILRWTASTTATFPAVSLVTQKSRPSREKIPCAGQVLTSIAASTASFAMS